jgi:hypothetical protein
VVVAQPLARQAAHDRDREEQVAEHAPAGPPHEALQVPVLVGVRRREPLLVGVALPDVLLQRQRHADRQRGSRAPWDRTGRTGVGARPIVGVDQRPLVDREVADEPPPRPVAPVPRDHDQRPTPTAIIAASRSACGNASIRRRELADQLRGLAQPATRELLAQHRHGLEQRRRRLAAGHHQAQQHERVLGLPAQRLAPRPGLGLERGVVPALAGLDAIDVAEQALGDVGRRHVGHRQLGGDRRSRDRRRRSTRWRDRSRRALDPLADQRHQLREVGLAQPPRDQRVGELRRRQLVDVLLVQPGQLVEREHRPPSEMRSQVKASTISAA